MVQNKLSNPAIQKVTASIRALKGLTRAEKKRCIGIVSQGMEHIKDERFKDEKYISELFADEFPVYTGTSLSTAELSELFVKMNYCKMRICRLVAEFRTAGEGSVASFKELLDWDRKRMIYTSKIVTANMGLVMAMARFVNYSGVEFTELVSDGGMTLMRATDKFDYTRGCRFSTYACRAILRTMARTARLWYRHRKLFSVQLEPEWEKVNLIDHRNDQNINDMLEEVKVVLDNNLANLNETEQAVLRLRFPFLDDHQDRLTLKEAGQIIGLSKERVRQIQNKSLAKLRLTMQQRMLF